MNMNITKNDICVSIYANFNDVNHILIICIVLRIMINVFRTKWELFESLEDPREIIYLQVYTNKDRAKINQSYLLLTSSRVINYLIIIL